MIRELEPFMPENQQQREKLTRWIHLLVDPMTSAQDIQLRVKRNRFLFMICASLMSGNHLEFMKIVGGKHIKEDSKKMPRKVAGLTTPQMPEAIADAQGIPKSIAVALDPVKFESIEAHPEWLRQNSWNVRLQAANDVQKIALKESKSRIKLKKPENLCSVHDECPDSKVGQKVGRCLDRQFEYLLTLAESYQQLMADNKDAINVWLQALSKIDKSFCLEMKGIRNDYMMLLSGYLLCQELKGPFEDLPSERLPPLTQAIATYIAKRKQQQTNDGKGKAPLNPASDTIEAFMNHVPKIEEGAFAFLSLSGNLFTPQ